MMQLNIEEDILPATDNVKFLGIHIDNKLKLNNHMKTLCSKVNKKISAFTRLNTYISREQALTICNAVFLSNFNYCPLIWLFCYKVAKKRLTAHTNVLSRSSMKTMNVPLKHCSLEVTVLVYMLETYRN